MRVATTYSFVTQSIVFQMHTFLFTLACLDNSCMNRTSLDWGSLDHWIVYRGSTEAV